MKFTSLLSIVITTASIATPASAVIGSLVNQVLGLSRHVPLLMEGIDIVYGFPTCAQPCLFSEPSLCAICDFGCRCGDYEHVHKQSICMNKRCQSEEDRDAAYKAWERSCGPYITGAKY